MNKPTNRLGRGLSALIPSKSQASALPSGDASAANAIVQLLPCSQIRPNARQPRSQFDELPLEELAQSIRLNGVLQPIIIRPLGDNTFEIVAGERRWRASRMAGRDTIPAVVRELSDAEALEIALLENLRREDLTPLERARAYQHYIEEFGVTVDELARKLSESRSNVGNYLRLLKLSPQVLAMLGSGELSMGHARAIAAITDEQRQLALAKLSVGRNLSVRQLEALSQSDGPLDVRPAATPPRVDRHIEEMQRAFSRALGLPVMIHLGKRKNSGRITISYESLDEFDRIAEKLGVRDV